LRLGSYWKARQSKHLMGSYKMSAILEIPASGAIGPSRTEGLPDELALVMGLTAAWSLSEDDGDVIVTLSDGDTRVISPK
jgi:hypothetical protein